MKGGFLSNRALRTAAWCALAALSATPCFALRVTSHYSPLDRSRAVRPETTYIILHTTEGPSKGSLNKLCSLGEAHYFVDTGGRVYRIIHRHKIATHAGRSMWNGTRNIDNCSIGIEVAGYHDRSISTAQAEALKELLKDLQGTYRIPDRNVLCHAMVAYGTPNRWHPRSHRGRKRCGMLFATAAVRSRLGLEDKPRFDPDVKAGRLVVGDAYLQNVLYPRSDYVALRPPEPVQRKELAPSARPAWEPASAVPATGEVGVGPARQTTKAPVTGSAVAAKPVRQPDSPEELLTVGSGTESAFDVAGAEYASETTTYFLPDGRIRRGDGLPPSTLERLPAGTRILVGYTSGGAISARRSAFDICGSRWNYPSTFYRLPDGSVVSGDKMREDAIPRKTLVFFRR